MGSKLHWLPQCVQLKTSNCEENSTMTNVQGGGLHFMVGGSRQGEWKSLHTGEGEG